MKIGTRFCFALSVVAILAPHRATAQKFQEPSKEELQMTSDPKAPGAPAVILYREEITDNANHFVSEYARIKVLTELGKEWATVEVPYSGGGAPPVIEGRTIHSDGTVDPAQRQSRRSAGRETPRKPSEGARLQSSCRRGGQHPGVPVDFTAWASQEPAGSQATCRVFIDSALASAIPHWIVQQDLFVHKERFYYNPLGDLERNVLGNQSITHYNSDGEIASYLLYSARLPAGARVQESPKHDYTLEIQDVPPFAHEADGLPEMGRRYAVRFYYTPYLAADVYWTDEGKRWARDIDRAAEPTGVLKAAAAQITSGAATDDDKARKLYDAVQSLENTSFSHGSGRASFGSTRRTGPPSRCGRQKSGSRNEIATLYLALARAAGLKASAMSVADRSVRIFDAGYLSLDQLTDTLVVLNINGADVFLDPGEKLLPYGQLKWSHTLASGLLETADGANHTTLTPPNNPKDAITAHTADLTVDARGAVTGTAKMLMNGPEALHWRQLNLTADTAEVQRQISESMQRLLPQGMNAELSGIQGLDTSAGFVSASFKVSGALGTMTGNRLLLPAFFFSTRPQTQFASTQTRESAIDLHFADQVIDDVIVHMPTGYSVESAPPPAQLPWPEHAVLVVKTQTGPGTIDIKHIFARGFVLLDPKEYPELHDYYEKIAANDQQQLVLTSAGAGSGN